MAEFRDKMDVFYRIHQDTKRNKEAQGPIKLGIFVNKELDKYRRRYAFMQNVTEEEYLLYVIRGSAYQQMEELQVPVPTDSQFWKAVYDYDPFKLAPNTHSDLYKYLSMKNLASVPLGMYGGSAKLELIRRMGALPNTETEQNLTDLDYATTDSGAISYYADAYPPEPVHEEYRVQDRQGQRLRRFASLGSVIHVQPDGSWDYTGHALVIDMGAGRDRQPWFVLASEWERASENAEGGFFDRAPAHVALDDAEQAGVLPGGRNRTVVGMVRPMGESDVHVLQRFGPEFEFVMGRESTADPTRGPDLAHIMTWYWDPVREVEVCYSENGKEYMAYDRKTKYYTYPSV